MYLGDLKIHCTLAEQHEKADARDMIHSNWDKILVDLVLNKIDFSNTISLKKNCFILIPVL